MSLLLYLAKVLAASGLLFGYYRLFLRNRQFHHYNRFYLLGALTVSMVLPLFRIPVLHQPRDPVNQVVYQAVEVLTVPYDERETRVAIHSFREDLFSPQTGLLLLYAAGMGFLLLQLIKSLLYIRKIKKQYPLERIHLLKLYNTSEPGTPFSFFRSVFWNDQLPFNSVEGQQIFRHELFHVQQRHSFDILLAETITALFWCNPFFHLIKKELKAIHEFLADQYAASGSDRYAYAELLVQQTLATKKLPIAHPFFQNHIKRRIAMITQLNQPRYRYWSRVMILPLGALLFCAITLYAQTPAFKPATTENTVQPLKQPITLIVDAGHGGYDPGAKGKDEVNAEKDITLALAQQVQELAGRYNINVVLTRNDDAHVDVKTRLSLVASARPDLLVSLHVSAAVSDMPDAASAAAREDKSLHIYTASKNGSQAVPAIQLAGYISQSLHPLYNSNHFEIRQRKSGGHLLLDEAPCPAILIDCGFITSNSDLQMLTDPATRQQIAAGILQGIVNYVNAARGPQPTTDTVPGTKKKASEPAATTGKNEKTEIEQLRAQVQALTKERELLLNVLSAKERKTTSLESLKNQLVLREKVEKSQEEQLHLIQKLQELRLEDNKEQLLQLKIQAIQQHTTNDSLHKKVVRHYLRNIRYPELARKTNTEGIVYFSIIIDENGTINNYQAYGNEPDTKGKGIAELVMMSRSSDSVASSLTSEEKVNLFETEIKRVSEKPAGMVINGRIAPQQYYFKAIFRLEAN
jgi:N-acetylmuramoyl-L-alanine amidase